MAEYVQMFNGNLPFKNGSYIYGKINKEIVPVYYTGGKTDTVQVSIDNQNRIITADLLGSVKNPINDEIISNEYTWSSQKIDQELSNKVEIDDSVQSTTTTWSSSKILEYGYNKYLNYITPSYLPQPSVDYTKTVAIIQDSAYMCLPQVQSGSVQYQWVDLINNFEDIHGENSENISIEVTGDEDKTIQVFLNDTVRNLSAVYISKSEGTSITASNQLTTKKYVDDKISSAITAVMGDVDQQLLDIISGGGV